MEESDRKILMNNLPELMEKTDVHCLLPKLVEKKVLTKDMVEDIEGISKPLHEQKRDFFLMIQTRGPQAFTHLWETLAETGHFDAARLLCPDKDPRTCLKRLQKEAQGSGDVHGCSDLPLGLGGRVFKLPNYVEAGALHCQEMINTDAGRGTISRQPLQIQVRQSTVYKGPPAKNAYQMMSHPRGYALIINNEHFENDVLDARAGSDVDVSNLSKLLQGLGYEVIVKSDQGIKDMEREVENFANMPKHAHVDSCIVAVLSHGAAGGTGSGSLLYSADFHTLSTEWLLTHFNNANCKALLHKPKLFILQACRGDQVDYGVKRPKGKHISTDSGPVPASSVNIGRDPTWTDMLIVYSTIPNMAAIRDIYAGSWFIESLCEVFMNHAHDTHLEKMLNQVSYRLMTIEGPNGEKQMCNSENRGLHRKVYFNPGLFANQFQGSV